MFGIKKVILDKLDDIIVKNNCELKSFIGFDVIKNRDVHGVEYELKNDEQKYYLIEKIGDISIFISEDRLLNTLLNDYIDDIESGDIYAHGYPESRLIPSNHHEDCQKYFIDEVEAYITTKVRDIIEQYF